jgi:hypothetical protein
MNDNKVGVDAISPSARPSIPDEIVELVEKRRDQMIKGVWDPFFAHEFVSNGTGLALENLPIPPAGTVVKPADEMPSDEWLLSEKVANSTGNGAVLGGRRHFWLEICSQTFARVRIKRHEAPVLEGRTPKGGSLMPTSRSYP